MTTGSTDSSSLQDKRRVSANLEKRLPDGSSARFGKVRFLVSTEAGGEGIDLQERCAALVHVDMPWNPMRLHQRVGRLSRYGQRRPVSVFILRNPDTVEARIWDLLNEKLERVQLALSSVMDEQEDISELVIGMAGNSLFNELFSRGAGLSGERLGAWFDRATATLGGRDVIETVRELLGNVARFDFKKVGKDLPRVDLPDLERFFTQAVGRHGRRVFRRDDGFEIKTPDEWKARTWAFREKYEGLVFDRDLRGSSAASRVLGVGHILVDTALAEARGLSAPIAGVAGLDTPLLIISVEDEVTGTGGLVHRLIFGATARGGEIAILRDWELLQTLNELSAADVDVKPEWDKWASEAARLKSAFDLELTTRVATMQRPAAWPEILLVPNSAKS